MSKFHSPWRKAGRVAPAQAVRPNPKGGAGEHFPWWTSQRQAPNTLSFNDFVVNFPEVAKLMGQSDNVFDRYYFKKVRSRGSPRWGQEFVS